ncbi:MAG: hypothetical protein P1U68_16730 [Verrucomicrobiales bacterium]|nr:hypothetical protein [Verrucomicrobiales bacterium]
MSFNQYSTQPPDRLSHRDEAGSDFMIDPLIDRHDISYLLKTNWKVICLIPLLCAALVTTWKLTREQMYESAAMLLVDSSLDQLLHVEKVGSNLDSVQASLKSLEVTVVADSVVRRVVEKLDLRNASGFLPAKLASNPDLPDAELLAFIQKNRIKATLQPETRIIRISALDPSPERARLIASTFVEEFQSFLAEQRRGEVIKVRNTIENQVAEAKAAALEAERELNEYRKGSEGIPLDQDHNLFAERLTQFGSDLNEAVRARVELEGIHESLNNLSDTAPATDVIEIAGYRNDTHFSSLLTALSDARSRLASARQQYTPSHPGYLAAEAEAKRYEEQIEDFADDLIETVKARYEAAQKREALLRDEVAQLQNQLIQQKSRGSEFKVAIEEVDNRWLHYNTLKQRLSENIISTEMPGSIATMVSEPLVPFEASGPPIFIFTLAGGFAGIFLVVGVLIWKILSGIPFTNAAQLESRFRLPVIADWTTESTQTDEANAMMPYLLGGNAQVMQISAPGLPAECRRIATKLAHSLAGGNRKTLLIQVKAEPNTARIEESGIQNLSHLTLSPEDIFDPARFSSVVPKLRDSFDKILIEAATLQHPPLTEWISSFADREVIAVAKGSSVKSEIARRVRRFNQNNDTRIGFIFTNRTTGEPSIHTSRHEVKSLPSGSKFRSLFPRFALKH